MDSDLAANHTVDVAQAGLLWALVDDAQREAALMSIPVMPALVAQQYGLAVLQGQARFAIFNVLRIARRRCTCWGCSRS